MIFSEALGRLEGLGRSAAALVPGLVIALVLFGVGLLVARGVRAAVRRAAELREASPGSAAVLGRIAGGMTILVSFLVAASVAFPSVSAADLFNLLGIGGVAIGFAFRDVLQNLLAGILILLTRPFVIGDQIRAGSHEGTVEDVWVRATVLRTYDNQRILIPNATLFVDKITIMTAHDTRRLAFPLTIGNVDDMREARRVIVEALRGTEGVLADPPPEALVTGLGSRRRRHDGAVLDRPAPAARRGGRARPCHLECEGRAHYSRHRPAVSDEPGPPARSDRGVGWRPHPAARRLARRQESTPRPLGSAP